MIYIDKPPKQCMNSTCESGKDEPRFRQVDASFVCSHCGTLHRQVSPNYWHLSYGSPTAETPTVD